MPFLRRKMTRPSTATIIRMSPHELMSTSLPGIHAQGISFLECPAEPSKRDSSPLSLSANRFALTAGAPRRPPSQVSPQFTLRRQARASGVKPAGRNTVSDPQIFSNAKRSRKRPVSGRSIALSRAADKSMIEQAPRQSAASHCLDNAPSPVAFCAPAFRPFQKKGAVMFL